MIFLVMAERLAQAYVRSITFILDELFINL